MVLREGSVYGMIDLQLQKGFLILMQRCKRQKCQGGIINEFWLLQLLLLSSFKTLNLEPGGWPMPGSPALGIPALK